MEKEITSKELMQEAQVDIRITVQAGKPEFTGIGNPTGYLVAFSSLAESILLSMVSRMGVELEEATEVLKMVVQSARDEVKEHSHDGV